MSMLNRWSDSQGKYCWPLRYGDDQSYEKAIAFLDSPGVLEDRGCGRCYARKFVKQASYRGVDGSGEFCDIQADLRTYQTPVDYILLRHVLEHNLEWETILRNALKSARQKLCLVIFTPFGQDSPKGWDVIQWNLLNGIPDISFCKECLYGILGSHRATEETISSDTQYGTETLFYVDMEPK